MIDIGVNLIHKRFDRDRGQVIERAQQAGVIHIIATGTSVWASQQQRDLAKSYDGYLSTTAGVHPHNARRCDHTTRSLLVDLAADPSVVAIGECGLDFDRNFSPPDVQERWFSEQLDIAAQVKLPVFLHCRAAHERFLAVLREHRHHLPAAVVHCFTGTRPELHDYLDLDCHIGVTGWICDPRRGQGLRSLVSEIPLERLLIETDAPFLSPKNFPEEAGPGFDPGTTKGRNEPCYLGQVCNTVAEATGLEVLAIAHQTTLNAVRVFGLDQRLA